MVELDINTRFVNILNTSYNIRENALYAIIEFDWDVVRAACIDQGIEAIENFYKIAPFYCQISYDNFQTISYSYDISTKIIEQTPRLVKIKITIGAPLPGYFDAKIRICLRKTLKNISKKLINNNDIFTDSFEWAKEEVVSNEVIFNTKSIIPLMVSWFYNNYTDGTPISNTPNIYRWIIACFSYVNYIYQYLLNIVDKKIKNIYYIDNEPVEDCLTFALNYYTMEIKNKRFGWNYSNLAKLIGISTGVTPKPYSTANSSWELFSRNSVTSYLPGNYPHDGKYWYVVEPNKHLSYFNTSIKNFSYYYIHGFSIPDFFLLSSSEKNTIINNIKLRLDNWFSSAGFNIKLSWATYKTLSSSDLHYSLMPLPTFYVNEPIDLNKIVRYDIQFLNKFVYLGSGANKFSTPGQKTIRINLLGVSEYGQENYIYNWASQTYLVTNIIIKNLPT